MSPDGTTASSASNGSRSTSKLPASLVNEPTWGSSSLDALKDAPAWRQALCVFCGSSSGNDREYSRAADQLGAALASSGTPLVYGGGTNGLMGAVAQATYASGGRVLGIIPKALMAVERPVAAHISEAIRKPKQVSSLQKAKTSGSDPDESKQDDVFDVERDRSVFMPVETMHQRKQVMASFAERGFIALPGGYGTMEEVLEMVTWTQLGIHKKPVVLLNINGFYSALQTFIQTSIKAGFVKPENESFVVFVDGSSEPDFDWGKAALEAVDEWHSTTRGEAYKLTWGETAKAR